MSAARLLAAVSILSACGSQSIEPVCEPRAEAMPDSLGRLSCADDFSALASTPADASLPGARSVKTVIDRANSDKLFFQNSQKYPIHWEFASTHLSGNPLPIVGELGSFNQTEYYSPERRFLLGAVTHYGGPNVFVYEIAPYDTATAEMIAHGFRAVRDAAYFGRDLKFHPTSVSVELEAAKLPSDIPVLTTDELYQGIDYQPLNLARALGKLRFVRAQELDFEYVDFREIVVLDRVPNDISVVSGIITEDFQTPLAHINVLSQNRKTPNMGLRGATSNEVLRSFEGQWVELTVGAFEWNIRSVTKEEADQWWEERRPPAVQVPRLDLTRTELADLDHALDETLTERDAIRAIIPAFGGKASHFAALRKVEGLRVPKAFVIPVYYYDAFMRENGFYERIDALLANVEFQSDARVRDRELKALRDAIKVAPIDDELIVPLHAKLIAEYPGVKIRFRSSTNAEDLPGFTGAGLYTSKTGDLHDPTDPIEEAIREVWASVWKFRAFEERSYRGIDHRGVGMALLVHRNFPDELEYANGVALTANPFDTSGLVPGFYINIQRGADPVVSPGAGITTDEIIYQYQYPGQPAIFISSSNQVPRGEHVLSDAQLRALGDALDRIHRHFLPSYGPTPDNPTAWYAMDIELKFFSTETGQPPELWVKQARPHPGRGE